MENKVDEVLERIKQREIDLGIQIAILQTEVANLKGELHDCANELCLMCGAYKREHEGACSDCRWLEARKKR